MRIHRAIWVVAVCMSTATAAQMGTNADLGEKYFPKGVFASHGADGSFVAGWYSSQLAALHEPVLMSRTAQEEPVYRFLLLPSFSHPVSVRVILHLDGTGTVISRIGGGAGGYAPKKPIQDHTKQLTKSDMASLRVLLDQEKFWSQSTEPPPNASIGCDGTEWILEGSDGGRYHVVERWEGASLTKLGRFFLGDLAGLKEQAKNASATQ